MTGEELYKMFKESAAEHFKNLPVIPFGALADWDQGIWNRTASRVTKVVLDAMEPVIKRPVIGGSENETY